MPSTGALFGNSATRGQTKNLVEFKAGKMTMKGKMVHPDKRKGLLYVYQSEDSLMHFCWKDRTTGTVEDDLIIFPDDCEFKRVEQCTTGRVYVLKFRSSNRKFFFWLQEPKTDKDEENCKKINEMLNNPPAAGSNQSGGTTPVCEFQNLLGSMTQEQVMQLLGLAGSQVGDISIMGRIYRPNSERNANQSSTTPSLSSGTSSSTTTTSTSDSKTRTPNTVSTTAVSNSGPSSSAPKPTPGTAPSNQSIQLSDLQKYLTNFAQSEEPISPPPNVDLSDALNSESIAGVLNDQNLIRELSPHLPIIGGNESTEQQLRSTITSPQFQQAVSMFSAALQSGHLGPVVQQFQVGENAVNAAREGNMEEFVKALENTSLSQDKKDEEEAKQPEKKKKTDEDKKDDDEMALG